MNERSPFLKMAKVISVHRDSHSVDLMMLDGVTVQNVPVMGGFAGSNFGFAGLVAPTVDRENPGRKTYPKDSGNVKQPDTNPDGLGRDIYAVVTQFEGSHHGLTGLLVLGFIYPQVAEMMFDSSNPDLMVFRHPADVQVTIDRDGKTSIQHPSGARITIGENADPVDLTEQDYDKLYRLRNNLGRDIKVRVKDTAGSVIDLDAQGNIYIHAPSDVSIEAGENVLVKAGGDARVESGGDTSVKVGGNAKIETGGNASVKVDGDAVVNATGIISIQAQLVAINSGIGRAESADSVPDQPAEELV